MHNSIKKNTKINLKVVIENFIGTKN